MVLLVLCFEVEFLCCLNLMYVFLYIFKFDWLNGRMLGMAAHSAYDMFSKYKYLIVFFVFPTSVFIVGSF